MSNLDLYVRNVSAFRSWEDLRDSLEGGYTPTLYPTSYDAKAVRRACMESGYRVFPSSDVHMRVTPHQRDIVEEYLDCSESSGDRLTRLHAKRAVVKSTYVVMSWELMSDFVVWLEMAVDDAVALAPCGDCLTPEQEDFARWSVSRSYSALRSKAHKAAASSR